MRITALAVLAAFLVLGGAWLWARSWKEKNIAPRAASDREVLARIERGRIGGGPGFAGELAFLAGGEKEAPRMIFVHGTPGEAEAWLDYLADPVPGFRALAYDRPGFGKTRPVRALPSLAAQARALARFLEARRGRRPILVGHSLGGPIICRAAAEFPDRVAGLVVVSGSLDPALERIAWYQKAASLPLVRALIPRALANSVRELLPLKSELKELAPLLAQIRCPVVIVHGDGDGLVPVANAAYLKEKLINSPGVETVIHKGLGHLLIWRNPELIKKDLVRAAELIGKAGRSR